MKTNTLKLILKAIVICGLTLMAALHLNTSDLSTIALSLSYVAVAITLAITALDYREPTRSYVGR